ncbi:MAG: hypothetical protein CM15mP49_04260 [Actinomycetota bacterium]|nr:MAG: hypothetical protein CM15mP49_04260 [Actinomycetota bacterium]
MWILHFRSTSGKSSSPVSLTGRSKRNCLQGALAGCHEALFTLGEKPELRYPAREWLDERGYESTIHYLYAMAQLVIDETGLLPHANAGAISKAELSMLREVSPSQGMMIESLNADLDCHRGPPTKILSEGFRHLQMPAIYPYLYDWIISRYRRI